MNLALSASEGAPPATAQQAIAVASLPQLAATAATAAWESASVASSTPGRRRSPCATGARRTATASQSAAGPLNVQMSGAAPARGGMPIDVLAYSAVCAAELLLTAELAVVTDLTRQIVRG